LVIKTIIETERLLLNEFTLSDTQLIFDLNQDPKVIRYTGDPIKNLSDAKRVLEQVILPQYALYNHGRWAVYTKSDMEFIGWCGLKTRPERNFDLGYRFVTKAWGKGFATEAAYASLQYGFEKLNHQRIVGRALPENIASVKVLEKIGMKYIGMDEIEGEMARVYEAIHPLIRP
jgi:[ribosomal protein S5]-alanine N-acetyltransferase